MKFGTETITIRNGCGCSIARIELSPSSAIVAASSALSPYRTSASISSVINPVEITLFGSCTDE